MRFQKMHPFKARPLSTWIVCMQFR